jgi:hypothetical protein
VRRRLKIVGAIRGEEGGRTTDEQSSEAVRESIRESGTLARALGIWHHDFLSLLRMENSQNWLAYMGGGI